MPPDPPRPVQSSERYYKALPQPEEFAAYLLSECYLNPKRVPEMWLDLEPHHGLGSKYPNEAARIAFWTRFVHARRFIHRQTPYEVVTNGWYDSTFSAEWVVVPKDWAQDLQNTRRLQLEEAFDVIERRHAQKRLQRAKPGGGHGRR